MERGFSHASQAMEQCAGKLDVIRDELHQAGGHMKNAGRALAGKEALEAQKLEADKGALARLRGLFTSCGKTFSQMERSAGRLAEKAGGEKSSVKTELRGLKPAQACLLYTSQRNQHTQADLRELPGQKHPLAGHLRQEHRPFRQLLHQQPDHWPGAFDPG